MAMPDYYADKLSARRLQRCYEIGPPRVQQYLEAELNYVLEKIKPRITMSSTLAAATVAPLVGWPNGPPS